MWVGKFETGYKGATSSSEAQKNEFDVNKVEIKPLVYSWREINVANAFQNSYHYKRQLESHMMKNTEWGAVAYLSHSKYGINQKIRFNNNNNYFTGYASATEPTCGAIPKSDCNWWGFILPGEEETRIQNYTTSNGVLGSTTGNITGIYDMSGGSFEYVMGLMKAENGELISGQNSQANSGFNGVFGCPTCNNDTSGLTELTTGISFPEPKYYDVYEFNNHWLNYGISVLGDAMSEMGPFFQVYYDIAHTQKAMIGSWYGNGSGGAPTHVSPWVQRGGALYSGKEADIFAFATHTGAGYSDKSYRIVLSL